MVGAEAEEASVAEVAGSEALAVAVRAVAEQAEAGRLKQKGHYGRGKTD